MSIVNAIGEYLKKHPNATKKHASLDLPFGINTIRKYWLFAKDNIEIHPNPNKTRQRNRLQEEELRRRIEFLDNLPVEFFEKFVDLFSGTTHMTQKNIALGMDVRSGDALDVLKIALDRLDSDEIHYEILFLDASDTIL
jgi:hypothetical protein